MRCAYCVLGVLIISIDNVVLLIVDVGPVKGGEHELADQFKISINKHLDVLIPAVVECRIEDIVGIAFLFLVTDVVNRHLHLRLLAHPLQFLNHIPTLGFTGAVVGHHHFVVSVILPKH